MDRISSKLSGDPTALVLGIVSLVIILAGCCCGLFTMVSLTLGIVGLVMANKSLREYAADPENYSFKSYKTVHSAKIINVIAIAVSALALAAQVAFFVINGSEITNSIFDEWRKNRHIEYKYDSDNDDTVKAIKAGAGQRIELKKQGDSIVIDTVANETQQ